MRGGENVNVKVECVRESAYVYIHMKRDWIKNVIVTLCVCVCVCVCVGVWVCGCGCVGVCVCVSGCRYE